MPPWRIGQIYAKRPVLVRSSGRRSATGRAASRTSRPRRGSTTTAAFGPAGSRTREASCARRRVHDTRRRQVRGRLRRRVEPPRRRPPAASRRRVRVRRCRRAGATSLTVLRRTGKESFSTLVSGRRTWSPSGARTIGRRLFRPSTPSLDAGHPALGSTTTPGASIGRSVPPLRGDARHRGRVCSCIGSGRRRGELDRLPVYDVVHQFVVASVERLGAAPWMPSSTSQSTTSSSVSLTERGLLCTRLPDVVVRIARRYRLPTRASASDTGRYVSLWHEKRVLRGRRAERAFGRPLRHGAGERPLPPSTHAPRSSARASPRTTRRRREGVSGPDAEFRSRGGTDRRQTPFLDSDAWRRPGSRSLRVHGVRLTRPAAGSASARAAGRSGRSSRSVPADAARELAAARPPLRLVDVETAQAEPASRPASPSSIACSGAGSSRRRSSSSAASRASASRRCS